MERIIGIVETRSNLKKVLEQVAGGARYVIVQRSKAKAVLMCPEELETLEVLADKKLVQGLIESDADIKAGRYVTLEDYRKRRTKQSAR